MEGDAYRELIHESRKMGKGMFSDLIKCFEDHGALRVQEKLPLEKKHHPCRQRPPTAVGWGEDRRRWGAARVRHGIAMELGHWGGDPGNSRSCAT